MNRVQDLAIPGGLRDFGSGDVLTGVTSKLSCNDTGKSKKKDKSFLWLLKDLLS